jgi:ADP-heptose:LPS heptosyltransferase
MTRAVADLKQTHPEWDIDVRTPCPAVWENNPHLTPLTAGEPGVEEIDVRYDTIDESGWRGHHFTDAFREDMEKKLGVPIKKTGIRPELWLSDEERGWINQVEAEFAWTGPFWVLNAGFKPDNELKCYPPAKWQAFVDLFNERYGGSVRLVQVGHEAHHHPELAGVYRLVGKTDIRQLIRLVWWAHGTIGPISFQMVMSAAFEQPAVCIAGGKEGVRWHIYPQMRWLWGALGECKDLMPGGHPRCFSMIAPRHILDGVDMYYQGGVLQTEVRGK